MTKRISTNLIILFAFSLLVPFILFAQVGIGAEADLELEVGVAATTGANIDGDVEVGADAEARSETGAERSSEAKDGASLMLNSLGVSVTASAQVNSEEDLGVFANNISVEKEDVVSVSISSDNGVRTIVVYNHKARFFGLFPITIRSTTEVESMADGNVEVRTRLPWWNFMVRGTGNIRSDIESRISNNASIRASAGMEASASARARIAESVVTEIESHAKAEASLGN